MLQQNKNLESLDLDYNRITTKSIGLIVESLASNDFLINLFVPEAASDEQLDEIDLLLDGNLEKQNQRREKDLLKEEELVKEKLEKEKKEKEEKEKLEKEKLEKEKLEKQKLELEKEKKDREEKEKKEKEEKEKKDKDEKEKKLEQERILAEAQLKLSQTKNEEEDPKRRPEKNISRGTQNDFIKQMGNTNGRNRRPSQLRKSVVEPQKKVEEKKSTEEKKDSDTESDESDEEEEVKPTKTVQPKVQPKTVQTPGPQPIVSKDGKEIKKIQKPAWMEKKRR